MVWLIYLGLQVILTKLWTEISKRLSLFRESTPGRVNAVLVCVVEQPPEGNVLHAELK